MVACLHDGRRDALPDSLVGQIDRQTAPLMVYEGAIYLHEGRQFVIEKLDWEEGIATALQTTVD